MWVPPLGLITVGRKRMVGAAGLTALRSVQAICGFAGKFKGCCEHPKAFEPVLRYTAQGSHLAANGVLRVKAGEVVCL